MAAPGSTQHSPAGSVAIFTAQEVKAGLDEGIQLS